MPYSTIHGSWELESGLWIKYGLWIMDSLWIGFGLNMLEQNGYRLDLELELSPSGTSVRMYMYIHNLRVSEELFLLTEMKCS